MIRWVMFKHPDDPRRVRWRYNFIMTDPGPLARGRPFRGKPTHPEMKDRRRQAEEARQWCHAQFGPGMPEHHTEWRWEKIGTSFQFRYEQDAFAFRMRWC